MERHKGRKASPDLRMWIKRECEQTNKQKRRITIKT